MPARESAARAGQQVGRSAPRTGTWDSDLPTHPFD
jgi:hypothetical protein